MDYACDQLWKYAFQSQLPVVHILNNKIAVMHFYVLLSDMPLSTV